MKNEIPTEDDEMPSSLKLLLASLKKRSGDECTCENCMKSKREEKIRAVALSIVERSHADSGDVYAVVQRAFDIASEYVRIGELRMEALFPKEAEEMKAAQKKSHE